MSEKIVLKAQKRDLTGKKVKQLRRQGLLPAVLYGAGVGSIPLTLDAHDAALVLRDVSSSTLLYLDVEGKEYPVLVRERQRDVIKGFLLHVDFLAVSMSETIRTMVGLRLVGESPVVVAGDAILTTGLTEVEVEALPSALVDEIEVDVSNLTEVGQAIYIRDLVVPEGMQILTDGDELVVVTGGQAAAAAAATEGEEMPLDMDAEPEVIERGKKEDEFED